MIKRRHNKEAVVTGLFRQQAMKRQAGHLSGEIVRLPHLLNTLSLALRLIWVVTALIWQLCPQGKRDQLLEPTSGVVQVYAKCSGIIK